MSVSTFLFLPHFDFDICDLLLNRRTVTYDLFVKLFSINLVLLSITYTKVGLLPYLLFSRHFYTKSDSTVIKLKIKVF